MNVQYEGEHLLLGEIGQISIYTAFIFSLLASIGFFISSFHKDPLKKKSWKQFARIAFFTQAAAILSIIICLFFIIHNHYFEYYYAWEHSSLALPTKYLLACFWEGQEGSFLLWMFWNTVLGTIMIFTLGENESRVLSVFSVVQGFLGSMLLGVFVFNYKVGSTPFLLLRDQMSNAPIFHRADYLSFIKDGNGLNPLLQNYWMVIHPPILFLGFASTLIPFSFAMSSLMSKNFSTWTKPVLPWALFSAAVLGTGIMMGGAWAYESLSFGGYWEWDPVENASLVPWLVLIAGIHTALVYNKTGRYLRTTYLFFILTFILVLYSTFLTRSGILGSTSVHAFTDLGMSGQLVIYMAGLSIPAIILMLVNWNKIPTVKSDEKVLTREFWIFVGSLIFFIAAIHIMFNTSLPVWNKLFGTNMALPGDQTSFYNKVQIWAGVLLALLSSSALYLKFKTSDTKTFWRRMLVFSGVAIILTVVIAFFGDFENVPQLILMFASIFGAIASLYYLIIVLSGNWKLSGAAVAHFGFGLLLLGILISASKKQAISYNAQAIDFGKDFTEEQQRTNMLLNKNEPVQMQKYRVTYIGDSVAEPNHYYKVSYDVFDSATGKLNEHFILYPNAQINPKMGLIANPDTKHYLFSDLYTHVTSVPDPSKKKEGDARPDSFSSHLVQRGDTMFASKCMVILESIERVTQSQKVDIGAGDLAVAADLKVETLDGKTYSAKPLYYIHNNEATVIDDKIPDLGLTLRLNQILPQKGQVEIQIGEARPEEDFIVMTALIFPFINLLWLGVVITILGFVISIIRRIQKQKKSPSIMVVREPVASEN